MSVAKECARQGESFTNDVCFKREVWGGEAILEKLLASWWARLSTGASREAPVDNECLGKCRQVGGSGESWNMSYWQLG